MKYRAALDDAQRAALLRTCEGTRAAHSRFRTAFTVILIRVMAHAWAQSTGHAVELMYALFSSYPTLNGAVCLELAGAFEPENHATPYLRDWAATHAGVIDWMYKQGAYVDPLWHLSGDTFKLDGQDTGPPVGLHLLQAVVFFYVLREVYQPPATLEWMVMCYYNHESNKESEVVALMQAPDMPGDAAEGTCTRVKRDPKRDPARAQPRAPPPVRPPNTPNMTPASMPMPSHPI